MDRAAELARLDADLADNEAQALRERVAREIPLRLSENALRLLIHHQVGDDRAGTGFATATEMASALGDGARALFASERWYAGAGLVRQLIECHYLIDLMASDRDEAERWMRADHDEIVATFMPRHMRDRAAQQFRASEYRVHSDWGSHPNPAGRGLLPHHCDHRPVPLRFLWVDLAQHLAEVWTAFESALSLFDPRQDPDDALYSPERSPDGHDEVSAAIARWRERDPVADRRPIDPA
jgi:hypothetical protein